MNVKLHINYAFDSPYYQTNLQDIADNLLDFDELEKITVKGVADVAASALSLRNIALALEKRRTKLVLLE